MGLPLRLTYLSDVKPLKSNWRVRVKILHRWRQTKDSSGETLDVIICDEKVRENAIDYIYESIYIYFGLKHITCSHVFLFIWF